MVDLAAFGRLLEAAEIAGQIGPAEFVVERRAADRPFQHDVQGRGDALRLAVVGLPGLGETGDFQMRHAETGQAGFGLRAAAGRSFVADLAAGTRGRARMRGNRGRVVVGLDLHQNVRGFLDVAVSVAIRVADENLR